MSGKKLSYHVFVALLGVAASSAAQAKDELTGEDAVAALESTFGVHPGERRNHIKGVCAVGEFVGDEAAQAYSRSPLFSGKPVPVIARFSVAGGNPKAPDNAKTPRGMALEFRLPDGLRQHMTMINTPIFGAADPQTFIDLTLAARPDPATGKPDPARIQAVKAKHPENKAQSQFLDTHNPPVNYANSSYFGIHTFKFINRADRTTLVRWQFAPLDGEKRLSDDEMKSAPPNFLETGLISRAHQGPIRWDMLVTLGEPGDPQDNPTLAWPDGRRQIKAGTLTIKAAMPQTGAECEPINYDPLVMADGIAATNDPILRFRSPAYAASMARRLAGQ